MKKLILFLCFLLSSLSLFGAPSDTVSTEIVTPGVIHTKYLLPGPFTLDVIEVDLTNPLLTLESYRPDGLTKTSVQSAANDREEHHVVAAVNGGFFSFETGWPIHNQVANGKPVLGIPTLKSAVAFTEGKKVFIDRVSFSGSIIDKNGSSLAINESNTNRSSGKTILYTSYEGTATGTDGNGAEAAVQILTLPLAMNDTLRAIVTQKSSGNTAIPPEGFVISGGSGTPASFITNNLAIGDTVKLYLAYNPVSTASVRRLTQLISGNGHLIRGGVAYPALGDYDQSGSGFNDIRNPRTFVGTNADTTKVYLCTVDGRQTSSLGMTFTEMANFLVTIGVTNALNLDGGGSTTMVVRGVVVNSPSDPGGERSVANSLQVISTAPLGSLTLLNIIEDKAEVFQGNTFQFHAQGKDQYYNPLALPAGTVWSADTTIGTIDSTGLFTAKSVNDGGWVRVQYNGIGDSARAYVRVIKELRVYPQTLAMVPGEQVTLLVKGTDSGGNKALLKNSQVTYINNASQLNVDAQGIVTSTGFGSGDLIVKLDTVTRIVKYSSHGTDTTVSVENFHDTFNWSWDVANTDPDNIVFGLSSDTNAAAAPAFKITFNAPPASVAVLNTDLPLSSRPDTIRLKVYGDGVGDSFKLVFRDKDGEKFSINATSAETWKNTWSDIIFRLVNAAPIAGGTVDFPIALEQIQITVGNSNLIGGKAVSSIYLDDIAAHYSNRTVAPQVLYDFNSNISGWLQPYGVGSGQTVGISTSSKLEYSAEHPYEGAGCGKWTLIDDAASSVNWSVRIARTTSAELADMLRGSYIGAWIWADGKSPITIRTVIRGGTSGICQGPAFPINHVGWKLIGTKLDENLFSSYLTSGKIVDTGNKFNGFHVEANNADVDGKTIIFYVDKMVTSALTVPTGFIDFGAAFDSAGNQVNIEWGVNSEISINRYVIERSAEGVQFSEIGSVTAQGNSDTTVRYSYYDNIGTMQKAVYRIRQITNDGATETTPDILFSLTGVNGKHFSPWTFHLDQNYPNPFNPTTNFQFAIPDFSGGGAVSLKVYDLLGREIATVVNEKLPAGTYTRQWNARNISSGVYFYRLKAGSFVSTKKLTLLK